MKAEMYKVPYSNPPPPTHTHTAAASGVGDGIGGGLNLLYYLKVEQGKKDRRKCNGGKKCKLEEEKNFQKLEEAFSLA